MSFFLLSFLLVFISQSFLTTKKDRHHKGNGLHIHYEKVFKTKNSNYTNGSCTDHQSYLPIHTN